MINQEKTPNFLWRWAGNSRTNSVPTQHRTEAGAFSEHASRWCPEVPPPAPLPSPTPSWLGFGVLERTRTQERSAGRIPPQQPTSALVK